MSFRTEKKYTIHAQHTAVASALLHAHCLPDPLFPKGSVHSIYYDSLDLQFLTEKIDSTYFKAKIRLRWYGSWDFVADDGPAFLEAKIKEGGRQQKLRVPVPSSGRQLAAQNLSDPRLAALPPLLARQGVGVPFSVRPIFTITYRRLRFLDPVTNTRIALDQDIHVPQAALSCPGLAGTTAASVTVIETKGALTSLPGYLAPLLTLGLSATSFSKYLHCYQMLTQQPA